MLIAYLVGSILGGAISGLSFDLHGLNGGNLVMCMLAKIFLMLVFVSIFTLISVAAKQKAWLALCGSLGGGMLLFNAEHSRKLCVMSASVNCTRNFV